MASDYQVNTNHNGPGSPYGRFSDSTVVPDMSMQLECDEVIHNWDAVERLDGYDALKIEARTTSKSPVCVPVSDVPQMYDDDVPLLMYGRTTPPNSPLSAEGSDKRNLLQANKEYVSHLLQLWKESAEYESPETTQVDLHEFEHSQSWRTPSDEEPTSNQSSSGFGSESHSSGDFMMDDSSFSPPRSSSPQQVIGESSLENNSYMRRGNRISQYNSPLNVNTLGPYDLLRSISPRIIRSPSPIFPAQRLLRSPSPNWEELQANLSEITAQDILLFPDERCSVRSHSPASGSDQEVPDIEMDVHSFYSDSEENVVNRICTIQSCQDQVVPEYIEE